MKKKRIRHITLNVMASLLVGDPKDPKAKPSREARAKFIKHLRKMKRLGVYAVTVDFWWALIEIIEGEFDWEYYDWIVNTIIRCGLKVIPILSFHQCGGNVGDDVFVPLRDWVWKKLAEKLGGDARDAKFISEQGNVSNEFVSFWATHLILENYMAFVRAFRDHFADRAQHIPEINISLGPAGELRYPSYNSHDQGTDYPTRGALQCYGRLAIEDFESQMLKAHGGPAGVDARWGTKVAGGQAIRPPSNPTQFFADQDHLDMQYGRDFFDWYSSVPLRHARMVMKGVFEILAADDSPMKGIDIGFKVPGIHWLTGLWEFDPKVALKLLSDEIMKLVKEMEETEGKDEKGNATAFGEHLAEKLAAHVRKRTKEWNPAKEGGILKIGSRLAELAAGLIRTSDNQDWMSDEAGRGYRPLVTMFSEFASNPNNELVLHFTCLEMADGENAEAGANSIALTLVKWMCAEACKQGVLVKGENAVWWNLPNRDAWGRMRQHLRLTESVEFLLRFWGLTILRMGNVAENPIAYEQMERTSKLVARWNAGEVITEEMLSDALLPPEEPKSDPPVKTSADATSTDTTAAPATVADTTGDDPPVTKPLEVVSDGSAKAESEEPKAA